jgi:hypothetical protein
MRLINEAFQGMKACANKLTKERGYDYFFREPINEETQHHTNRERGVKRSRIN